MESVIYELLDLALRWIHLIAGIMWIGNSMLFNWLDRNLVKLPGASDLVMGEIWLLHGGGFYQVEKKMIHPHQMPKVLHWFKWQSYTTWITGILLFTVVYYLSGRAALVDPQVMDMSHRTAVAVSVGLLLGGWALYDGLWRALGDRNSGLATALSLLLGLAFIVVSLHLFSPRAAYMQIGAMLGSLMSGNVLMHIMPSQRRMMSAMQAGQMADPAVGARGKKRSIHNNYMTFPVLFIMVSNHFPSTWGNPHAWLVLTILAVGGATARHILNIRFHFQPWLPALLGTIGLTFGLFGYLIWPKTEVFVSKPGERVAFKDVQQIVAQRCVPCHAAKPTDPLFVAGPPAGVMFDNPVMLKAFAPRIKARAVDIPTMPLANKTGMTPAERELLGRWVSEGAHTD